MYFTFNKLKNIYVLLGTMYFVKINKIGFYPTTNVCE